MDETKPEIIIKLSGDIDDWKGLLTAIDFIVFDTTLPINRESLNQFSTRVRIALNLGSK